MAAAAYRAGEKITNEYDGQTHDYTRKQGVVFEAILIPANAPAEYNDRAVLWNAVEKIEKAKNAQLAREVRVALPAELTLKENAHLVYEYAKDNFVDKGMVADIAIHDKGDGNPHAHVLLTMRPFEQDGSWAAKSKMEYILDENGERIKLPSGRYKTKKINATDWDERSKAEEWRSAWADMVNQYLEKGGHKSRVDHRSYERQGVGQIPTVHLGVAAHDMEKRGIATERGDTNRRIKAANARLKDLDKQIHEIRNPPIPQLIIDLEKSIKAQGSPGYENWCRIFNLQQAAHTLIYMQENGFADMKSLQSARQNAKNDVSDIENQITANKAEIKALSEQKKQAEIYRQTMDVYKKYNATIFKKKFYASHKDDIDKHIKARAYIFDELKLEKFPSLKKLSGDISGLYEKEKSLRQELKVGRQKIKGLSNTEHNVRMLLGYRELELQGYTPTIPTHELRFAAPYKQPFGDAHNARETEEYFRSCNIDVECANEIYAAALDGRNHGEAAEEVLVKYGKQRAEWVVAAIVNNAQPDRYSEHRKWAELKGNTHGSDPTARNVEVFQKHNESHEVLDSFIRKFREIADGMKYTRFTVYDTKGNETSEWGFALPREFPPPKAEESNQDLSFAERMAAAQRKAQEQNSQRPSQRKRSGGHEL